MTGKHHHQQGRARPSRVIGVAVCLLLASAALASPQATPSDTRATPDSIFTAANQQLDAALAADDARPGAGQAGFLAAAALYANLIEGHGIENHALHANRGAALLLGGDLGRAIAAFRRAERLDPTDAAVTHGLSAARARVQTAIAPAPETRARDVLLAWRGRVERATLLGVALTAYSVAWLAGAARVLGLRRVTPVVAAAMAVALLAAAPLALEAALTRDEEAVVIAPEVVGLNGPSHGAYAPTFASPLTAGVECRILEHRGGWVRIGLADGSQTWLPTEAVEAI